MRMRLLGGLEAEGVNLTRLGSRKARRVLARLTVARGSAVAADTLADVVWGDDQPSQPADQLSVLVSRLRSALRSGSVVRNAAGYGLAVDWLDIAAAEELAGEARRRFDAGAVGPAQAAARGALELLRGPVLPEQPEDTPWLEADRAAVARSASIARLVAAEATLAAGDPWTAAILAEAALKTEPYDEAALRILMVANVEAGRTALALRAHADMAERLGDALGVDPDAATQALHVSLLRGDERPRQAPAAIRPGMQDRWPPDSGRTRPQRTSRGGTESAAPTDDSASSTGGRQVAGSRQPSFSGHPRWEVDLPGRRRELGQLTAALARTNDGFAQLVVVDGEAGIGKTRLLSEFAERVGRLGSCSAIVLTCRGDELAGPLPLQPLLDALAGYVRRLEPDAVDRLLLGDAAPVRRFLGLPGESGSMLSHFAVTGTDSTYQRTAARRSITGGSPPPSVRVNHDRRGLTTARSRRDAVPTRPVDSPGADPLSDEDTQIALLFAAYDAVIARLTVMGPVVICIDDVQWCDAASRVWLGHAVRRLAGLRLLIVAAQRLGEGAPVRAETMLSLDVLDRSAAAAALASRGCQNMRSVCTNAAAATRCSSASSPVPKGSNTTVHHGLSRPTVRTGRACGRRYPAGRRRSGT